MPSPSAAESRADVVPNMVRGLRLRDLVLFNLAAIIGIRWLAVSAKAGPSALTLWIIAALFFFIPLGLAVAELAARHPDEGGIYRWTQRNFGDGHGYLCGWCYWICNVVFYPSLLISTAVMATYAIGMGGTSLGERWSYVLPFTLVALWGAALINIRGIDSGKWLQNLGGLGSYLTGTTLVAVAIAVALHHGPASHGPANAITIQTVVPRVASLGTVNLWASIAFAFSGIELIATMAGEIRDPERTLPRSIYISAPLILLLYLAGTTAMLWLVPTADTNLVSGVLQAVTAGTLALGPGFRWVVPAVAAAYTIGTIGAIGAWLIGPARIVFAIGLDYYFPPAFGRVHPKWKTPHVAILVEAALATILIFLAVPGKGTTVEGVFLVLLDMDILIYFIPFCYLFLCLFAERDEPMPDGQRAIIPGGSIGRTLVASSGFVVTVIAMVVAMVPPPDTHPAWVFELKVVGGAIGFILLGATFYWRNARSPDGVAITPPV